MEPSQNNTDQFIVEDLLDFPNDDDSIIIDATFDSVPENSTHSSSLTSFSDPISISDTGSHNLVDAHLCSDLCVPDDDDIAEMEWLSNFVEESFSCEDLQKLELISGIKARNDDASKCNKFHLNQNNPLEVFVPTKGRSKRPRMPPCNWTSRLLVFTPQTSLSSNPKIIIQNPTMSSIAISIIGKKSTKVGSRKRDISNCSGGDGRKCMHCAADKTPQWRTGPMGPKTLCNACGVRYKSGRLVPEYRPASSPTFVLAKHSNSHRKVLELRRQKEMVMEANNNSCNIIINS
ncbi:putative transcription factor C2C2-GATA family [Lupinus albus]|uniref:GATA transcription factor n=1 Tax=Lupinus albus TaxID=3870 RepID=A0A6A4NQR9_LUPAL|nr:putative transcription factor C2C2-GATA family [Lupinus albus]